MYMRAFEKLKEKRLLRNYLDSGLLPFLRALSAQNSAQIAESQKAKEATIAISHFLIALLKETGCPFPVVL